MRGRGHKGAAYRRGDEARPAAPIPQGAGSAVRADLLLDAAPRVLPAPRGAREGIPASGCRLDAGARTPQRRGDLKTARCNGAYPRVGAGVLLDAA